MKSTVKTVLFIFAFIITLPAAAVDDLDDGTYFEPIILEESKEYKEQKSKINEKTVIKAGIFSDENIQKFKLKEPKTITFENGFINQVTPVINMQGTFENINSKNDSSNFTYPFSLETGADIKFGELKNRVRVISNLTRNVDEYNNKFLGKLSDVYFEREINKNNKLLIGNSRIAIGYEGATSQYSLLFNKRSMIADEFANTRAAGIRLRGDVGKFDYDIGGYSSTRYLQDFGDGVEFAGMIYYSPFENHKNKKIKNLKFGGGINTGTSDGFYSVASGAIIWNYDKFLLNMEYAYADGSNADEYNPLKRDGFYTTVGYNINEKLQLVGRYEMFDPNKTKHDDLKQNYTIGLNYYILKQRLRLSVDYTFSTDEKDNDYSNAVTFMTQIMI